MKQCFSFISSEYVYLEWTIIFKVRCGSNHISFIQNFKKNTNSDEVLSIMLNGYSYHVGWGKNILGTSTFFSFTNAFTIT